MFPYASAAGGGVTLLRFLIFGAGCTMDCILAGWLAAVDGARAGAVVGSWGAYGVCGRHYGAALPSVAANFSFCILCP